MKARKRVITSRGPRTGGARRTPTVRRIKPAIVPAARSAALPRGDAVPRAAEEPRERPSIDLAVDHPVDLSVDLGRGLVLANPLVAAAGSFAYGVELAEVVDLGRIGAICTKGTTLRARSGNPPPRLADAPAGLVNSIGLHNPGIDAVLERHAPVWRRWSTPVIVNVAGESVAELTELARRLDETAGVAAIELDLSCPNVGRRGLQFAVDPDAAASATVAVRRATDLPLLVKLSPVATDLRAVARAVADAGADAISAVNTLPALAVAVSGRRPALGAGTGGLSGPALRPIALRAVHEIAGAVRLPIVASGGVSTLSHVLEFLAVGASAVAVGTAALADPALPARLADELGAECARRGLVSYRDLVGTALRRP